MRTFAVSPFLTASPTFTSPSANDVFCTTSLGVPNGVKSFRPGGRADAAADAQHHEILGLVGHELVEPVLRDHHAFVLADNRSAAVAEREGGFALQNDEGVILAAVGVQRVLATAGADLDVPPRQARGAAPRKATGL